MYSPKHGKTVVVFAKKGLLSHKGWGLCPKCSSKIKRRLVLGRENKDGEHVAVAGVPAVPVFPGNRKWFTGKIVNPCNHFHFSIRALITGKQLTCTCSQGKCWPRSGARQHLRKKLVIILSPIHKNPQKDFENPNNLLCLRSLRSRCRTKCSRRICKEPE